MSMSTFVIGFRPPDEKWRLMKQAWDACKLAGVPIPRDVENFFGGAPPDSAGVEVNLGPALAEWSEDMRQGYELDLTKLPPNLTRIRFYNSW